MTKMFPFLLAVLLGSLDPGPGAPPAGAGPLTREERWREDVRYAVAQLEQRHADLYHSVKAEDFGRAARALEGRAGSSSEAQMIAGLARLLAMVGDGHTGHFIPWDRRNGFRRYPLEVWMAPEGPLIIATPSELSHLRGAVITSFGRSPAHVVEQAVRPLVSVDNAFGAAGLMPSYIVLPELLHALGLIDDMERLPIEATDASGRRVTAVLQPVPDGAAPKIEMGPVASRSLWLQDRDDPYWVRRLPGEKTLFIQYNDASREKEEESVAAFCERIRSLAASGELDRIVLDLRWNDGGSLIRTRPLLHTLIRLGDRLPEGKLFVLVGRMTFSAAGLFAVELEQHTAALFVGEPTAARPNGYGELRRFRLPHSGLEIRYSAWRYQPSSPGDTRPAILPDLTAVLTAADFRAGRDPGMEAVRAYRPRTPAREAIRKTLEENGAAAALQELRRLEKQGENRYIFGEEELDALARERMESGRLDQALELLARNAEKFPWSAKALASLADALARAGRCAEARRHAETAFALDKSYLTAGERLERSPRCR